MRSRLSALGSRLEPRDVPPSDASNDSVAESREPRAESRSCSAESRAPSAQSNRWARSLLALLLLLAGASTANAQLDPSHDWRTIRTDHFRVHYTRPLEEQARRAAASAERAWERLSEELVPPRGTVDLVVADDVDFANGYATVFPTNRIVVYAHPPVDARSLRFYDDWNELVVTHELVHVFHLDRTRGWWRAGQYLLGRNPLLFPATWTPAWLVEGLAVYYESRITGSGRLYGAEHRMFARAAAAEQEVPTLDRLSLATSRYPGGQSAYAYGSLLFDHLARTRGAERVPRFVERAAGTPVPYFTSVSAGRAFGVGFARAWAEFRDSLTRAESGLAARAPLAGWRDLTHRGRSVAWPRWSDSSGILFAASTGRETPAVYRARLDGDVERLARRNGVDPNVPLPGGGLVWSQPEYTGAYRVRSDLWTSRGGRERRLTRNARVTHPDARGDGRIVAVQAVPAGTRLVLVAADGEVRALTGGGPDEQWAEPRWSPDGSRIAAVRWRRGGLTDVVVLDSTGAVLRSLAPARAVNSAPAWTPDGATIVFSSDRDGVPRLWTVAADDAAAAPRRLAGDAPGLFQPSPSPDGARLAAIRFGARGEFLGVAPLDPSAATADPVVASPIRDLAEPARSDAAERAYSPWAQLLPRYWMPLVEQGGSGGWLLGASSSGSDVIGRHSWRADASWETRFETASVGASWRYAGLGQPVLEVGAAQLWDWGALVNQSGDVVDHLGERTYRASLSASLVRPRYRTSSFVSLGADVEQLSYRTLRLDLEDPYYHETHLRPSVVLSAGWSNAVRPPLGISPEDGVSLAFTARRGWLSRATPSSSATAVGTLRGYKSLDLPGFAHHVLALRLAGGWMDPDRATSLFGVGGTSGTSLDVLPGVPIGESPRTFAVRGYAPSTLRASQAAAAASLEYRLPLTAPSRGLGLLPFFLDRVSLSLFSDAGSAWCTGSAGCFQRDVGRVRDGSLLVSAGAELVADFALQYDVPARARLGVATPLRERGVTESGETAIYFTFGPSF